MWFMNRWFRFKWYSKVEGLIIGISIFMLILPFFFAEIGGSHAWILIGGISLQPSEFAKPLIIIIYCYVYIGQKKEAVMLKVRGQLFKGIVLICFNSGIVAIQKDMGTLVIICLFSYLVL